MPKVNREHVVSLATEDNITGNEEIHLAGDGAVSGYLMSYINADSVDGMYDMSRAEIESLNMLTPDAREDNIKERGFNNTRKYGVGFWLHSSVY